MRKGRENVRDIGVNGSVWRKMNDYVICMFVFVVILNVNAVLVLNTRLYSFN